MGSRPNKTRLHVAPSARQATFVHGSGADGVVVNIRVPDRANGIRMVGHTE
jgi:hypothetical protein